MTTHHLRPLARLAAVLAVMAGSAIAVAPSASASYTPTNCSTQVGNVTAHATCRSGGGTFRVVATCVGWNGIGSTQVYGSYVRAGSTSMAGCRNYLDTIKNVSIQKQP